jgi:hypothetical protein
MASLAEINLFMKDTDYEYASFSMACCFISIVALSIANSIILILRHSSISDHPVIQLRFNTLFTAFKQKSLF